MVLHLIKVEFKLHAKVFVSLALFQALFGLLFSLRGQDEIYSTLNLLISMTVGIYIPLYIYRDMYNSFFMGTSALNQMIPIRSSTIFMIKSLTLATYAIMVWVASLVEVFVNEGGMYRLRMIHSESPRLGILYMIAGKLSSVVCEVGLIGLGIIASTFIFHKKIAVAFQWLLPLCACIALFVCMRWYVPHFNAWMIGTTSIQSYKQYAGFLAVNFDVPATTDISSTVQWESPLINSLAAIVCFCIVLLVLSLTKYEVHGEQEND